MKKNKIQILNSPSIFAKKNIILFTFDNEEKQLNYLINGMPGIKSIGLATSSDFSIFIFKNCKEKKWMTLSSDKKIIVNLV